MEHDREGRCIERRYDFDWLRGLVILLVAGCHVMMVLTGFIFGAEKDNALFGYYFRMTLPWLMPVLFIMSGACARHALHTRPWRAHVKERAKRLLVPLVFGTLVIVPPQVYCERLYKGQFHGSYVAFYPHIFEGLWPAGNFAAGHLWFVGYLFAIALIALPFCACLERGRLVVWLAAACERSGAIFLFAVPLAFIQFLLLPMFPWTWVFPVDWAMISWYLCLYLAGYAFNQDARFWRAIEHHRLPAFLGGLAFLCLGYTPMQFITPSEYSLASIPPILLSTCVTWCMVVAALGFSFRYLRFDSPLLHYVREASYPFYILHQTVVVMLAYYVLPWNIRISKPAWDHPGMLARYWDIPILIKFVVVFVPAVLGTVLIYELAVRRWRITRFLFGMNPSAP